MSDMTKQELYLVIYPSEYTSKGYRITFIDYEPIEGSDMRVLRRVEVEYPAVCHDEIVGHAVAGMESAKEQLAAEYHAAKAKIDEQIQSLMALEAPE